MRKLGEIQRSVLDSLQRHGSWHPRCGWVWDNYSGTIRILESLVKRGLVVKVNDQPRYEIKVPSAR